MSRVHGKEREGILETKVRTTPHVPVKKEGERGDESNEERADVCRDQNLVAGGSGSSP